MRRAPILLVLALTVGLTGCSEGWTDPHTMASAAPAAATTTTASVVSDTHEQEASFTGTVTGYDSAPEGSTSCGEPGCLYVDGALIELTYLTPYGVSCLDRNAVDDLPQALAEKQALLPIGARVHVVRPLWGPDDGGIVHLAADWNPARPMHGSVNERLVARGWWVPDEHYFNTRYLHPQISEETGYVYDIDVDELTGTWKRFVLLLTRAANLARRDAVGGQLTCVGQLRQQALDDAESRAEIEQINRRVDRWWRVYVRDHPEALSCRDGDGDGRCGER